MESTSYIALSRQMGLWREMDIVANNLANMNTTGYKNEQILFSEYLVNTRDTERRLPEKLAYTTDFGTMRDLTEGAMESTANPLDLALDGEGYFVVEGPTGPLYTRAGRFTLTGDGMLTTSDGLPVLSTAGTPVIVAPTETELTISSSGTVSTENGVIGQLDVATFEDQQSLLNVGAQLFDAAGQEPQAAEGTQVRQGFLERSNVVPVVEMTRMIDIQRSYEAANKLIETENERVTDAMRTLSGAKA